MAAVQYLYTTEAREAEARGLVSEAMDLAQFFCEECSLSFRPGFARGILRLLSQGFEPDLIRAVIGVTSVAPCPSWQYFAAIMKRAESEHAFRLADFDLYRQRTKQVTAQQYTQRQYTEAELLAVSEDLVAEARRLRDEKPGEEERS